MAAFSNAFPKIRRRRTMIVPKAWLLKTKGSSEVGKVMAKKEG